MTRFKTILTIGAMSIIGALSRTNAQTCPDSITYYETRNHVKLIENQSHIVINYRDTVPIYGLDTLGEGANRKIVCDIGNGNRLIYDMNYYMRKAWMPPHQLGDTAVASYQLNDTFLTYLYTFYDGICDDCHRDSVETLLLENRRHATEYIKNAHQTEK